METSTGKTKRLYERPRMTAVELQHRAQLLQTSGQQNRNAIMNVTYEEEDI